MELKKNTQVYFDDLTHTYLLGGKELIGVTTLMKKMGLAPDYSGIPAEVLENAARRGHAVHKAIETFCQEGVPVIEEEYSETVLSSLEAYKALGIKAAANEYLVSDNESIASSIDLVGEDAEGVTLYDIKTTSEVHRESVAWQLSIYKWLFNLANPYIRANRLCCLHIRDGVAKVIEVAEVPQEEVLRMIRCFKNGEAYTQPKAELPAEMVRSIEKVADYEMAIADFERRIKEFKTLQETVKGRILAWMKDHNLKKWEVSQNLSFTYIEPTTRLAVDSTRLKKEQPEVYSAYLKESQVKESLRINLNK